MNKISLYSVLFVSFLGSMLPADGQDTTNTMGKVSIASPTAASLGKYGDIPVSYNTGIPSVSIPIYTAKSGSLSLPIGLSYHASGLKVQENASWVGAGWSLNAGGVITRTVVGQPDDRGLSSYNNCQYGHYSDYGFNSYQWISGDGFGAVHGMVADDRAFETGVKDGEPDLYFFNFGNYSGKFYFNDDRTPVFMPEEDFKVAVDLNNASNALGFQGFVVTTPDGVKYFFGKTGSTDSVAPIETTIVYTLQSGLTYNNAAVSSWFLNKVVSADGMDSIKLTYHTEQYSYYTMAMYPRTNVLSGGFLSPDNSGYNVVKNFVSGVRLSGISFANGTVSFTPSAAARTDLSDYASQGFADVANTRSFALGSIQVSDSKGFCKKDSLYYGYFFDSNPYTLNSATYGPYSIQSDAYRLRLDSVQELTCDASIKVPPYKFSYFSELVPRKLSFGMDHWGFSNGVVSNQSLIPTYTLLRGSDVQIFNGSNRDAAWPAMRGGALQKITYPTGGYTALNFEANDTYVQYTTYTLTTVASPSVGFGNTNPAHFSFTTDNSTSLYKLTLTSTGQTGGSGDNFQLTDPLGTVIVNDNVPHGTTSHPDSTVIYYHTLSPNTTYTGTFFDNSPISGTASASLKEQLATSVTGNVIVGGLRIKSDTSNDGLTTNNLVKSYAYNNGGTASSGILYSRPVYVQSIRNDLIALVYGLTDIGSMHGCIAPDLGNPNGDGGNYYISPTSITPMSTFQGNHIGYNQVQVSEAGNGYSIYRYYGSDLWDSLITDVCTRVINTTTCPTTIPNFPAPPEPFEPLRGQLKYEGHFPQTGTILKDATYTYSYSADPMLTPGIKYITVTGMYSFTPYFLQSAKKVQTQVVSTLYDPSGANAVTTTNTQYYGSAWHHQPTRKVTTTSTGDSLVTNIKYAFDFRVSTCDAIIDSLPIYNSAVQADSVILFRQLFIDDSLYPGQWLPRYDTFQDFRRNINLARIQYINYRRRSFADSGNLLSSCYVTQLNSADALLKPVFRLQNEFYNAPVETTEYRDLNLRHASFIQYDTSVSPVGFAYPGRTQLVNLQSTSGSFTNAAISGNSISRDSRYQNETIYKFTSGNPLQSTGHDGISSSYIWDYNNKEPIAKVVNATVDQVAHTSFEADGNGSWTIGSSLREAGGITGTQSYSLSNGSCSRSGLNSASTYKVSYWSKTGTAFSVTGSTTTTQGKTVAINGINWTYFEHIVSAVSTVTVSGSGDIDELRLYPGNAQMTTYTYSPVIGMTSQCDVGNRVTYYFYDSLGRMQYVKDQDGNILKTIQYHYKN